MTSEGMGRRKRHDGAEYDIYSPMRRLIIWGRNEIRDVKRATHKRERATGKRSTWQALDD